MSVPSISRRVLIAALVATPAMSTSVWARPVRHARSVVRRVSVTVAIDRQGRATPQWIGLIRDLIDADELAGVRMSARAMSSDDAHWIQLIRTVAPQWMNDAGRLDAPFRQGTPPAAIEVVIGDQGGDDAFATAPNIIAFDLSALNNAYGMSDPAGYSALIGRLLSREYTRLRLDTYLDSAGWSAQWAAKSPLLETLRTLYIQGLCTLRGIEGDPRWTTSDGTPTDEAKKILAELEPVMVDRLKALAADPSAKAGDALTRDMMQGPLSRRWGALPIALWLAADSDFEAGRISAWIDSNPDGLLQLAVAQADPKYQRAFADIQSAVPDLVAKYR